MLQIIKENQLYYVGKITDLLEILETLSQKYTTVKSLIDDRLKS